MIALTLGEVAALAGGTLRDADPGVLVTGSVEYDSRLVAPGGVFVAFDGEHVDGHDFVAAAREQGAVAALVTRPVDGPRIEVADAIDALTALAAAVVRRTDATVVGITGSSGKTSTKDLLAHLLAAAGPTVAPLGSANNELGLPYTVLKVHADTSYLVLEMGARGLGHIAHLARIAPPRVGVVLNVGSAHLGEFGSREAIAQAKGELVEALPADGLAVLNADDPLVRAMADRTAARVVTFGLDGDVRATDIALDDAGRPRFRLHSGDTAADVRLRLVGKHHVSNSLAAAAVALDAGLPVSAVAEHLSSATPASRWRMEVTERPDGVLVINDAYNANPESMRAALDALVATRRRAFAVLGPMAELGSAAAAEHEALGRRVAELGIARLIAVGDGAQAVHEAAAVEASWNGTANWVPDVDAAVAVLRGELRPGDAVLVKASRAASLERIALAIAEDDGAVRTTGEGGT
jgi:UDP-N-acetylmuramoyl-tripeptide--D-alanyl-D-alanine ligase